jgi:hypothetical protein
MRAIHARTKPNAAVEPPGEAVLNVRLNLVQSGRTQ